MSERKQERDLDYICTAVGGIVLLGLVVVWGIATMNGMRLGWKTLAIPAGVGVVLMLPFRQLQRLLGTVASQFPFGGGGG